MRLLSDFDINLFIKKFVKDFNKAKNSQEQEGMFLNFFNQIEGFYLKDNEKLEKLADERLGKIADLNSRLSCFLAEDEQRFMSESPQKSRLELAEENEMLRNQIQASQKEIEKLRQSQLESGIPFAGRKSANRRIYISGGITGVKDYRAHFEKAEKYIQSFNCEAVNPCREVPFNESWKWGDYMREDLKLLADCTAIYMLKGWRKSRGARLEKLVAKKLGLKIMHEK